MSCHNELCGGVADLSSKALMSTHMYDDPITNPDCTVWNGKSLLTKSH